MSPAEAVIEQEPVIEQQVASGTTEAPADCVILVVQRDGENTQIIPVIQGDVRPTEVQTIIELGLAAWRAQSLKGA